MRKWLIILSLFITRSSFGQLNSITGNIIDTSTSQPIEGVTIILLPVQQKAATNAAGNFFFKSVSNITGIRITAIGYASKTIPISEFHQKKNIVSLDPVALELSSVTV